MLHIASPWFLYSTLRVELGGTPDLWVTWCSGETSRPLFEAPSICALSALAWSVGVAEPSWLTTQLIQSSSKEPGGLVVCKTELLGGMLTVIMHQQRTAVICVYLYWSLNNTVSFFLSPRLIIWLQTCGQLLHVAETQNPNEKFQNKTILKRLHGYCSKGFIRHHSG